MFEVCGEVPNILRSMIDNENKEIMAVHIQVRFLLNKGCLLPRWRSLSDRAQPLLNDALNAVSRCGRQATPQGMDTWR